MAIMTLFQAHDGVWPSEAHKDYVKRVQLGPACSSQYEFNAANYTLSRNMRLISC